MQRSTGAHLSRRRSSTKRRLVVAALMVVVVIAALVGVQLARVPPAQTTTAAVPADVAVPGTAAIRWPAQAAQAAVQIGGLGPVRVHGTQTPVAIASLAKMMTAYVVVHDHPLVAGRAGPAITVTAADVAAYARQRAANDSVVAVAAGETLTERQAIEALLVPSADNVATLLAAWDAGSVAAFVTRMNTEAAALGLHATHYADPSGLDQATVSTAADQLVMTRKVMAVPALAAAVAMPSVTLPVAGSVPNYDTDVGHHGVIGVKTGSDFSSQGCWAFAAHRRIAGARRTVYGVVLGVPGDAAGLIAPALAAGVALADAVTGTYRMVTVVPAHLVVGFVRAPWRGGVVPVETAAAVRGVARAGTTVRFRLALAAPTGRQVATGQALGSLRVGGLLSVMSTAVVAAGGGAGPGLVWRLTRR